MRYSESGLLLKQNAGVRVVTPVKFTYEIELEPGETIELPSSVSENVGPGHWIITVERVDRQRARSPLRDHSAFLNSYVPQDEGLYDDYPAR